MASYPKDRFDDIPKDLERVGAHRAPRKRGRGWVAFAWAALATVVLVGAGAIYIGVLNSGIDFAGGDSPTSAPPTETSAAPTAPPTVDPTLSVTVLNGTPTSGLAGTVADLLRAQGWTVGATSNASQNDIAETVVYYADPTFEGAARGVAAALPGADIALSADFAESGAQLVVVLGADYVPPAA